MNGNPKIPVTTQLQKGASMTIQSKLLAGAFAGLVLTAFAVPAGAVTATAAPVATINQKHLMFIPDTVTVHVGDTVRFTDGDAYFHDVTVTGPDGAQNDKGLQGAGKYTDVVFSKPGTYHVTCRLHPAMKATVVVNAQ